MHSLHLTGLVMPVLLSMPSELTVAIVAVLPNKFFAACCLGATAKNNLLFNDEARRLMFLLVRVKTGLAAASAVPLIIFALVLCHNVLNCSGATSRYCKAWTSSRVAFDRCNEKVVLLNRVVSGGNIKISIQAVQAEPKKEEEGTTRLPINTGDMGTPKLRDWNHTYVKHVFLSDHVNFIGTRVVKTVLPSSKVSGAPWHLNRGSDAVHNRYRDRWSGHEVSGRVPEDYVHRVKKPLDVRIPTAATSRQAQPPALSQRRLHLSRTQETCSRRVVTLFSWGWQSMMYALPPTFSSPWWRM